VAVGYESGEEAGCQWGKRRGRLVEASMKGDCKGKEKGGRIFRKKSPNWKGKEKKGKLSMKEHKEREPLGEKKKR